MNKVILLVAALVLSTAAFAQSFETKNTISIRFGQSNPLGDFKGFDSDKSGQGYAMNGINFGLNYEHQLDENFRFTLGLSSSGNIMNDELLTDQLTSQVQEQLQSDDVTAKFNQAAYGLSFVNVGFKYLFGGEKVKMYINPVFGFANFVNPEQEVDLTIVGNVNNAKITTSEFSDLSFAFGANTGFEFRASELISINLNFEYINSSFDLELENETRAFDGSISTSDFKTRQNYEILNTTIGVGFNF